MANTGIRSEALLGPVRWVQPDQGADSYELNVIDGWVKVTERGLRVRSRVREVLDAAPECAGFITHSHLLWLTALRRAGSRQRAAAQRRALDSALLRHGLAVNPEHSNARP